ncbi:hypothetical protein KFL_008490030 [Klebsormidium nitens]|uniref:Uncharacterized protein n=1 Tax=Klebsormidium nitens TaxID=105231 RepID=A0A1Y1IQM3_KLENI|nr:hypothetical protein KFL_008490030 [Klebsormidium nitens]|eukprot:GAQ91769.1 hypothetical protein KFL_008490030 [Klebsormidium nitens]
MTKGSRRAVGYHEDLCELVFVSGTMASPTALRLLALSALLLLCAPTTSASATPRQLVDSIKRATQQGQALQAPAQSITIINGPLIVIGQGPFPKIIVGFTEMITELTTSIAEAQGAERLSGADTTAVADAVRDMVRVHQALLNILIGKAGLFNTVPFIGQPVAEVLRQYEGVIDAYLFQLTDLASSEAASKTISGQQMSLDGTTTIAINAYSGLGLKLWQQ